MILYHSQRVPRVVRGDPSRPMDKMVVGVTIVLEYGIIK